MSFKIKLKKIKLKLTTTSKQRPPVNNDQIQSVPTMISASLLGLEYLLTWGTWGIITK
jgi:hypothetical protein